MHEINAESRGEQIIILNRNQLFAPEWFVKRFKELTEENLALTYADWLQPFKSWFGRPADNGLAWLKEPVDHSLFDIQDLDAVDNTDEVIRRQEQAIAKAKKELSKLEE